MGLIVSNPPYVPLSQRDGMHRQVRSFESHVALLSARTGFELYDRMVADVPRSVPAAG
jgi:release factor glutamine methyltransferase